MQVPLWTLEIQSVLLDMEIELECAYNDFMYIVNPVNPTLAKGFSSS